MKIITLCTLCFLFFLACKKDNSTNRTAEDSKQLLKRVVLTSTTGNLSYEVANYRYNSEGSITAEGTKTYVRDEKQRIVRILDSRTPTSRADIQVYYSTFLPSKVAYTLCTFVDGKTWDSVVYVHDNTGQLVKKLSYLTYLSNNNLPVSVFLSHFEVFAYDESGNLMQLDFYNIDQGRTIHCGQYRFARYDTKQNPMYSNDEVRSMEYALEGVINASKNNCITINDFNKNYEYRADGKPKSCLVRSATQSYTLTFEYQ